MHIDKSLVILELTGLDDFRHSQCLKGAAYHIAAEPRLNSASSASTCFINATHKGLPGALSGPARRFGAMLESLVSSFYNILANLHDIFFQARTTTADAIITIVMTSNRRSGMAMRHIMSYEPPGHITICIQVWLPTHARSGPGRPLRTYVQECDCLSEALL